MEKSSIAEGVPQHQWITSDKLPPGASSKLKRVIKRLREKDFVETVTVSGKEWDVYQTTHDGEMVFLAWRPVDGTYEIVIGNSMKNIRQGLLEINQ